MSQFYTYVYRDPRRDDEPFYVGKGSGARAYSHLKWSHNRALNFKVQKMIREGVSPLIDIIDGTCEKDAFALETQLIAKFGRKDQKRGSLLNGTDGGDGASGRLQSLDERARRSERWLGNKNPNSSGLSNVTKSKISAALTGQKRSAAFCIKASVAQIKRHQEHVHPLLGKVVSDKTLFKLSKAALGKKWWNNGVKSILSRENPGSDWSPGRMTFSRSKKC